MTLRKHFVLFSLITFFVTACGGGDDGGNSGGPGGQITGSWLSPCTTVTQQGGSQYFYRITMTFNADNTMKYIENFYQEDSCQNLVAAGLKTRETLGGYQLGADTTASDGAAAKEINLLYGQVLEDSVEVDPGLNKVVLSMFRITGNELTTSTIDPVYGFPVRSAFIHSFYPYTYR